MIKTRFYIILVLMSTQIISQNLSYKSIMQEQTEKYAAYQLKTDAQFDSVRTLETDTKITVNKVNSVNSTSCTLTKKVFGWHPYWNGSTYTSYQWNLLSDLCYFSYDVSSTTGNNTNTSFAWSTASVVTVAQANGTKVHICAALFSGHSTFWASSTAQTTCINNLVALLNSRGGNGINIDFEGMGSSDNAPFVTFMTNLKSALTAANPAYKLSVCLYAVDWSGTFNMPALNSIVDFYTIMGYDYYYSGSAQAGPEAPLYNFQTSYNYTLSKTITTYIKNGATPSKILLGLPYYGREWQVAGNTIPASTTGTFTSSRTLSYVNSNPTTYSVSNKYWDANAYAPYYAYTSSGNWRQCFIDDIYSMGRKYDMVNQRGLGGIGIWALGYDNGMTSFWNLLQDKFSSCAPIVCNDSIFDMGGPARNYYDNEKYYYTLTAPTGSLVQLQFKSFGTEQGYDSLFIYNGTSTVSPLIGSYTGTNSPGIVTSTGQNLTLRFKSDGATNSFGFKAIKSCITQTVATGIQSSILNLQSTVNIYPNPTNGKLFIHSEDVKLIYLFDAFGRLMYFNSNIRIPSTEIDFKNLNLPEGLYFVKIVDANEISSSKKIIFKE